MNIYIGSDHRGVVLKQVLVKYLKKREREKGELKYTILDVGCHTEEMVNYPKYAQLVCRHVIEDTNHLGILICHTANGMAISANRHPAIRAAITYNSQVSEFARRHNNANIICLPAGYLDNSEAFAIVDKFLDSRFEGGRHAERLQQINNQS